MNTEKVICQACHCEMTLHGRFWQCDVGDGSPDHGGCGYVEEQPIDWYFTFGCGQFWANHYIIIHGTYDSARNQMHHWFGEKWSMQYDSADAAGVERFNLKELKKP